MLNKNFLCVAFVVKVFSYHLCGWLKPANSWFSIIHNYFLCNKVFFSGLDWNICFTHNSRELGTKVAADHHHVCCVSLLLHPAALHGTLLSPCDQCQSVKAPRGRGLCESLPILHVSSRTLGHAHLPGQPSHSWSCTFTLHQSLLLKIHLKLMTTDLYSEGLQCKHLLP